jgi:hypothetical protein
MGDLVAAVVLFASKVKDDPGASDVIRNAAGELHAAVSKLITGDAVEGSKPRKPRQSKAA